MRRDGAFDGATLMSSDVHPSVSASQVAGRKLPDVASELLYTGKLVGDESLGSLHPPRARTPVGRFPMRPAGVKGNSENA